jgi:hypothetical protein
LNGPPGVPQALRRALEADHRRVRPLPPPSRRMLWVALCAAALLVAVPLAAGLRPNAARLGLLLLWGGTAVQLASGLALVVLALREAIPGAGLGRGAAAAALAGGIAVQVLISLAGAAIAHTIPAAPFFGGAKCMGLEEAIGAPALLVAAVLIARAYAVRPAWAGLLGGAGAGLIADGVWRLVCPYEDVAHLLVWHTGAVLLLAAAGWTAGAVVTWCRRR